MDLQFTLKQAIDSKDVPNIKSKLAAALTNGNELKLENITFVELLLEYDSNEILELAVKLTAELAKSEENRKLLTNETIIKSLKSLLKAENDIEMKVQIVRTLGNLCYENEEARKIINKDGLETLLNLIEKSLSKTDDDNKKLMTVSCGYLLNLLMSNSELQKTSLKLNILNLIENILRKCVNLFEEQETCITHSLYILSMVTDHMIDEWLSESLIGILVHILRISVNPEISALCLELLRAQSENNEIKLFLAKDGTCQLVYNLVEKHGSRVDDEDSRALLKMACDLIVLILTGDESMDLLYENGNGVVYKHMLSWLHAADVDLLSTGVLAMGNFARNDSHCIRIVEDGLGKELLDILSRHNSTEESVLLQHALLSALRNLSIPVRNKKQLLDENLVDILLRMIESEQSPVIFKLLGTLRMVVDGQEETAKNLIQQRDFVKKLVYWCYNSDHLGVRGEAPRLLCWLIKNCHSSTHLATIPSVPDSIKCLVEMISTMHAVMQNEALLALNLLCASSSKQSNLPQLFIDADLGKHIAFVINKYHEKMERETIENMLILLEQLTKFTPISKHLLNSKVNDTLKLLTANKNATPSNSRISKLITSIEGAEVPN